MERVSLKLMLALYFSIITPASQSNESEEVLFKKSLALIKSGNYISAKKSLEALKNSPLHLYSTYKLIQKRPFLISDNYPEIFLARPEDSVFQDRYRKEWLNTLFRRKKFDNFIKIYEAKPIKLTKFQCMYYQSKIRIKSTSIPKDKIINTWTSGKSLPKICDYSFKYLYRNKLISSQQYWDRILKAIDKKNIKLALFVAKKSQNRDIFNAVNTLKQNYRRPERYLRTKSGAADLYTKDILVVLIQRAMARNLERGLNFKKIALVKFDLSQVQIQRLKLKAAVIASLKRSPKAITLLDSIGEDQVNSTIQRLQIQQAIIHKDWDKLTKWTKREPSEEIPSSRWLYWRAYALNQTDYRKEATLVLQRLAERRDYYGFLAADQLSKPYNLANKRISIDRSDYEKIIKDSNLYLANKLFFTGRKLDAKREFLYSLKKLNDSELHAAALLADSWDWAKGVIFAIGKSSNLNDLKLRFPILYEDIINDYLKPKTIYRVRKGDSLWKISKILNLPIKTISKHNELKNNVLMPGQVLKLPASREISYSSQPKFYKVKTGDTLSGIARKFNSSVIFLKRINSIKNSNKIKLGQIIKIRSEQIKRKFRVSQHQVLAIIRAESAFDRFARSPANARGLMQLIPTTARSTAKKHGILYKRKSDLYNAEKNILLGSSYLEDLYNQFDGNFAMAAAGYNAGPHRVSKWQKRYCGDPILWIDTIPITETRRYVRRTLFYSLIYEWQQTGKSKKLNDMLKQIPATRSDKQRICEL